MRLLADVPEAMLWGIACGVGAEAAAGAGAGLLAALLTMWMVLRFLILYTLKASSFFMTRPE